MYDDPMFMDTHDDFPLDPDAFFAGDLDDPLYEEPFFEDAFFEDGFFDDEDDVPEDDYDDG